MWNYSINYLQCRLLFVDEIFDSCRYEIGVTWHAYSNERCTHVDYSVTCSGPHAVLSRGRTDCPICWVEGIDVFGRQADWYGFNVQFNVFRVWPSCSEFQTRRCSFVRRCEFDTHTIFAALMCVGKFRTYTLNRTVLQFSWKMRGSLRYSVKYEVWVGEQQIRKNFEKSVAG